MKGVALAFATIVLAWLVCSIIVGLAATVAITWGGGWHGMAYMTFAYLAGGCGAGLTARLLRRPAWVAVAGVAGVWAILWGVLPGVDWYLGLNAIVSLGSAGLVAGVGVSRDEA